MGVRERWEWWKGGGDARDAWHLVLLVMAYFWKGTLGGGGSEGARQARHPAPPLTAQNAGHESWVLSVAAHPGGAAFATGGSDGKVKLWDLATRTCAQSLGDHGDQVWAVAFRGDGGRLASASDDKSVCLYDCA